MKLEFLGVGCRNLRVRSAANWFLMMTLILATLSLGVSSAWSFSGLGAGTPTDPYLITTVTELQEISDAPSAHYALGNDIDAATTANWNGGQGFKPVRLTSGAFEGRGFSITGLHINRPTENNIGLFGTLFDSTIRDVDLVDAAVSGSSYVGALLGLSDSSQIINVGSSGTISGNRSVGGLVGGIFYGTWVRKSRSACTVSGGGTAPQGIGGLVGWNDANIEKSNATGDVSTGDDIGGLVGYLFSFTSSISECYASGDVVGGENVGGLVGAVYGSISDSYALGDVTGVDKVGGFAGGIEGGLPSASYCYSTGTVTGTTRTGGFLGRRIDISWETILDNYWDVQTSATAIGVGRGSTGGVTGQNTTAMKQEANFTNWDFNTIWVIDEGNDYPRLRWEFGELYSSVDNWMLYEE